MNHRIALSASLFLFAAAFTAPAAPAAEQLPPARRVLLIGVDGFGAEYIPWDKMPRLSELRDAGVYATARCHRPTASAINWKSALSGQPSELHGFNKWNSKAPDIKPHPATLSADGASTDVFAEIRRQRPEAKTFAFFAWDGIAYCTATNRTTAARQFPKSMGSYADRDSAATDEAIRALQQLDSDFVFAYQAQVDEAGHANGWGSPEFIEACTLVDVNIGRLIDTLVETGQWEDTAVILVADHGGLDKGHGGKEDIRVFNIPFVVSGGAARGLRLREPVILADTTPTILALLGLEVPEAMRGRPAAAPAAN